MTLNVNETFFKKKKKNDRTKLKEKYIWMTHKKKIS